MKVIVNLDKALRKHQCELYIVWSLAWVDIRKINIELCKFRKLIETALPLERQQHATILHEHAPEPVCAQPTHGKFLAEAKQKVFN